MKFLKSFVLFLALMAMMPVKNYAQNPINYDNFEQDEYVFEILDKLKLTNKSVVADAQNEIDNIVEYAVSTNNRDIKTVLKKSVLRFVEESDDCECVNYLFSILPKVCTINDVDRIFQLIDNERLADGAIKAVADMPDTGNYFLKYIETNQNYLNHKGALAYAAGKQNITSLENDLIAWLKGSDDATKIEIYKALVVVGSSKKTASIVEKGAKKLYKSKNTDYKIEGMKLLAAVKGEKAMPMLYKSLKNTDRRVRLAAFELMKPYADDNVCAKAVKICKEGEPLIDVINWLGEIKDDSQMALIINGLSSENPRVMEAAIRAVFKIDNPEGIAAVKPMFGGKYQEVITDAMLEYEGDYTALMNDVLKGTDNQKLAALQILEKRPVVGVNTRIKALLYSDNQQVKDEAFKVLKYVVAPANAEFLSYLLAQCDDKYVEDVQLAIKNAMGKLPDASKDQFASTLKHVQPEKMPRYYKVFAYFGTDLTIDKLIEAYESGEYKNEAKEALLLVENEAYKERIAEVLKH